LRVHPEAGELARTFQVTTTASNDLVAEIHHRMPVFIRPEAYDRWLRPVEPDPRDLLAPYPWGRGPMLASISP
jgi:putative SOS response-associated peptidase YedK